VTSQRKIYPADIYRCGICGARGVKLWREWNTMVCFQTLRCFGCAAKETKKPIRSVDEDGRYESKHGRTDQIEIKGVGTIIPAVPDTTPDENDDIGEHGSYWGYTAVPPEAVAWWRALPLFAPPVGEKEMS
jgi:hypothetical protein